MLLKYRWSNITSHIGLSNTGLSNNDNKYLRNSSYSVIMLGPRLVGGDHWSVSIHLPKWRVSTKENVSSSVVSNISSECFLVSSVFVMANLPAMPKVRRMFNVSGISLSFLTSSLRDNSVKVILISLPRASPAREKRGLVHGMRGCLWLGSLKRRTLLKMCWEAMWLRKEAAL